MNFRFSICDFRLQAALEYARSRGAKIVEAYPLDTTNANVPDISSYVGFAPIFRQAGFVEVARRSEHQPIMRYVVADYR